MCDRFGYMNVRYIKIVNPNLNMRYTRIVEEPNASIGLTDRITWFLCAETRKRFQCVAYIDSDSRPMARLILLQTL